MRAKTKTTTVAHPCIRLARGKFELTNQDSTGGKNSSVLTSSKQVNSLVVRRASPGRIIAVLFWTKYAVPRQIKPGVLKVTTSRGQSNLRTVQIFVSCEEKGCYRIVSLGHLSFDCRYYCVLSRRMQGWANSGYCALYKDYMETYCKKSCGKCWLL